MKNRATLIALFLTIGFVGATSCGNETSNQNANLAAENAALKAAMAARGAGATTTINQTSVVYATKIEYVTQTLQNNGVANNGSSSGTTTVTASGQ